VGAFCSHTGSIVVVVVGGAMYVGGGIGLVVADGDAVAATRGTGGVVLPGTAGSPLTAVNDLEVVTRPIKVAASARATTTMLTRTTQSPADFLAAPYLEGVAPNGRHHQPVSQE
jgi:hypothetical protein